MKSHQFVWMAVCLLAGCSTPPSPVPPPASAALFRDVAAETGLVFSHFNGATCAYYTPEIVGSGVALFDYDGDGDLDVFLVQGDFLEPGHTMADASFPPPPGWKPGCRLFRNDRRASGAVRFTDVTESAGIVYSGMGMGVAVADYDNDGHPDLLVTGFRGNRLYHNNGDGTFSDVTTAAGITDTEWSTSASFVDYDRDGRLDLFVTHYVEYTLKVKQCDTPGAKTEYCAPSNFHPTASCLFHNEGHGRFRDVSVESMIASKRGPGLGVLAADLNQDGWPDLYVANDGAASHLWISQGNGTFREQGVEAGVAYDTQGRSQAGMGVSAGDFDNDGDDDLFKTNLIQQGANLYRNDGTGQFSDAAGSFGLLSPSLRFTGFGAGWFDYDNDGWLDLAIINGAVYIVEAQRGEAFPYRQPNQLFHNDQGKKFRDVSQLAGEGFAREDVGRSVAFGDINGDGCVDMVVANNDGLARMLLNACPPGAHWLEVKLQGVAANRDGIGAYVTVRRPVGPPLRRLVHTDGSFLAASDVRAHFGLGGATELTSVRVEWPFGATEEFPATGVDRVVTLVQGKGK